MTVQGPVKEQQPDGMSHRGLESRLNRPAKGGGKKGLRWGGGDRLSPLTPPPPRGGGVGKGAPVTELMSKQKFY